MTYVQSSRNDIDIHSTLDWNKVESLKLMEFIFILNLYLNIEPSVEFNIAMKTKKVTIDSSNIGIYNIWSDTTKDILLDDNKVNNNVDLYKK